MRARSDSVVVQRRFISVGDHEFTVPQGGGVVMHSKSARDWKPEAEPMPSSGLEDELRVRARERIREGRLPCITHYRTWGGRGSNEPCALCDSVIKRDEVEYEIELLDAGSARLYRFHFLCHDAWVYECAQQSGLPQ
jgi:hypothetical protein